MRALSFLGALAATVLLHVLGVRWLPGFAGLVDLFLVLAVLHALDGREVAAQLGGLAAGLTHDALSAGPFGLFGLATTVAAYLTAVGARRLVIRDPLPLALVFMVASALHQAIALGLATFFLASLPAFGDAVLTVLSSGILGLSAFLLRERVRRRYDSWRRLRMRRLH